MFPNAFLGDMKSRISSNADKTGSNIFFAVSLSVTTNEKVVD